MKTRASIESNTLSRRGMLASLAGAAAAIAPVLGNSPGKAADETRGVKICIFSKHLQWLDYKEMAATTAEIGFDGIDLTVRPGGHVEPERVEEDLPRAFEAAKAAHVAIPMMTTAINDASQKSTGKILKTASRLGIRFYRLGYFRYNDSADVQKTLSEARSKLGEIARLNQEYGICGDYQNHAGREYFGAPIWDLWEASREVDPRWIGSQFDIRHAVVEGANTWALGFRLLSHRVHTLAMKDFIWQSSEQGWKDENCPLGKGAVDFKAFLKLVKRSGFSGPISLHLEYPLAGAEGGNKKLSGDRKVVLEGMKTDLKHLRHLLADAGIA
jgi:sugar phosphate isomerase/epimerase